MVSTRHPEITWTEVDTAVSYDLYVNNLTTDESQIIRSPNQLDTIYDLNDYLAENLPTGLINADYRVWVRAFNPTGLVTHWSAPFDFTVIVPKPLPPTLIAPNNSNPVGGLPVFTWTSVAGADHYEILVKERIGSSTDGQPIVIDVRNVPENTFTPSTPLNPGNYRWWVRAVNNVGLLPSDFSDYSAPMDFTVSAVDAPAQPATPEPAPGEQQATPALPADEAIAVAAIRPSFAAYAADDEVIQPLAPTAATVEDQPAADSVPTTNTPSADLGEMDTVMKDWPDTDWWDDDLAHPAAMLEHLATDASGTVDPESPASADRHLFAGSAPLLALAAWRQKRRKRGQQD